ncbi:LLM class flavin-dependent oxidoreductase [Teichococcus vastitatis]|uniref:LLM class flavin-dependent oxidoreductase n=1 Tax=Teichococcus vastitatis TaxID=2307076 RepID=A0ABS9W7D7_9PROT|nr:LLM class flavin-dependent oxidoreductase [Pseudoroseomonas vastitatis]MCI0755208.1 LLM class flavin-dependent oxidoreductase [Pseudoroseomonas vastitatis]
MQQAVERPMMNLMTSLIGLGSHLAGWRHPDAWSGTVMNFGHALRIAQLAERGKFDLLFLADGNAVRQMDNPVLFSAPARSDRPATFEPLTLLAALSQHTRHVGLFATATTTYDEPYLLARRFASLDHLSGGRACWNVVTGSYAGDSVNFGRVTHVPREERYERAREFIQVCKGLWDSWAEDAFPEDKASGRFLDPAKVQRLDHVGKHFSVQGPLNVARPVQGYPLIFTAGQSEPGRELAAEFAEGLFSVVTEKADSIAFCADVKSRMAKYGRTPDQLRILPACTMYVGRSEAEADDLYGELQELITPELGVEYLSRICQFDLRGLPLDGPLPEISGEVDGAVSYRDATVAMAKRENLSIRQTYQRVVPTLGHMAFKGDPVQIADQMEDWYRSGACDGFNLDMPVQPRSLETFVELVVPELQRRGIFRTEYPGGTLRDTMGLKRPERVVRRSAGGGLPSGDPLTHSA